MKASYINKLKQTFKKTITGILAVATLGIVLLGATTSVMAAGLMTPVDSTKPALSIKSHHVNVTIEDGYAITEVEQTFSNPHQQDLEAIYSFPTPEKGVVSEFTIWIDGKPVIVGIRPEDFEDAAMVDGVPEDRRLTSKVTLIEALGSELMVHFRLDAKTVDSGDPDAVEESTSDTAANAVGRFHPRSRARIGDTIDVAVAIENVHFFDHDTHKAIWT